MAKLSWERSKIVADEIASARARLAGIADWISKVPANQPMLGLQPEASDVRSTVAEIRSRVGEAERHLTNVKECLDYVDSLLEGLE